VRLNCGHPWTPRLDAAVETLGQLAKAGEPPRRRDTARLAFPSL